MKRAARSRKTTTWQVHSFGKRNVFRMYLNDSREGFCRRGRGMSFHVDGPKTGEKKKRKKAGTNSAESGARDLEAENIRSRIHSTSL